jgi:hypothetical protein
LIAAWDWDWLSNDRRSVDWLTLCHLLLIEWAVSYGIYLTLSHSTSASHCNFTCFESLSSQLSLSYTLLGSCGILILRRIGDNHLALSSAWYHRVRIITCLLYSRGHILLI